MMNEEVLIVDKDNNVIGSVDRSEMRARGLTHRATYILVFNDRGELFVQKRTMTKDVYPGYYDIAAGGVVQAGEEYMLSACRELEEELGVVCDHLLEHFDHYHEDAGNRVWGRVYSCIHNGPFILQKEEVESGSFMSLEKLRSMSESTPFTPDGLVILRRYFEEKERAGAENSSVS